MTTCSCGIALRTFWVWTDDRGVQHASAFRPTKGPIHALLASTSRDALLPFAAGKAAKHDVRSLDNPAQQWRGRCDSDLASDQIAV